MGDKGDPPPDGGGSNPEIAVVLLLMKRMADKPAIVPEASHPVDRLDVDRQGPGSSDQPVEFPEPRGAPARLERAVAGFGDGLGKTASRWPTRCFEYCTLGGERGRSRAVKTFVSTRTVTRQGRR